MLVVMDAHSKWFEAFLGQGSTSALTIARLRALFAREGLPEVVVSDNGTCFTSQEFQEFMSINGISHVTTAPYHPASNGLAEHAVQTLKGGLKRITGDSLET